MMYHGIDTAARITAAQAWKIKAHGLSFVGRYLIPELYSNALTATEADSLREAGLAILLCWELTTDRAKRGASIGATDGARARKLAESMGIPKECAIYFAVDYSPAKSEYEAIQAYFLAAKTAVSPYQCGIYGPYAIVEAMKERIPSLRVWQCVGGSGGKISVYNDVYQSHWQKTPQAIAVEKQVGFPVDLNECKDMRTAGLWMPDSAENDEPKPWYADAMEWNEQKGIMNDGRPEDNVTRAEQAVINQRLYNTIFEDMHRLSGLLSDD